MKIFNYFLLLGTLSLFTPQFVNAQVITDANLKKGKVAVDPDKIYVAVENQAKPVDGLQQFYIKFANEFKAPKVQEGVKQLRTILSFVVEKDGSFSNIKAVRDPGYGTGAEAIRALETMPKWIPASQNGQNVRSQFNLPITINLKDDKKSEDVVATEIASKDSDDNLPKDVYLEVDKQAKPKFGLKNFYTDFRNEFTKVITAPKNTEVLIFLCFIVEKDGSISNIKVVRDSGNYSDKLINILQSMPIWLPAEVDGQKVRSLQTLPIKIKA